LAAGLVAQDSNSNASAQGQGEEVVAARRGLKRARGSPWPRRLCKSHGVRMWLMWSRSIATIAAVARKAAVARLP